MDSLGQIDVLVQLFERKDVGAILLDVESFSDVNDYYGKEVADHILKQLIRHVLLEVGTRAWHSVWLTSDMFLILKNDSFDAETVETFVSNLEKTIQKNIDELAGILRFNVGVSNVFCVDALSLISLISQAKKALALAKSSRIANIQFYRHQKNVVEVRNEFNTSLKNGEFVLYYHPLIRIGDMKAIGYEALIRQVNQYGVAVEPGQFLDKYERAGKAKKLAKTVLDMACRDYLQMLRAGFDGYVSVNLTTHDLMSTVLDTILAEHKRELNEDFGWLVIELVETHCGRYGEQLNERIKYFRKMGLRFAIDDFGAGYNGFQRLTDLDLDVVKIDRSFVTRLRDDQTHETIIKAIIDVAHAKGCSVIVEGIESAEQLTIVMNLGAHAVQGFYFGQPMPLEYFFKGETHD